MTGEGWEGVGVCDRRGVGVCDRRGVGGGGGL